MINLILEPDAFWQRQPPGFRRHHRTVEVVGPSSLWQLLAAPGSGLDAFLSQAAECGLRPSLTAALLSRLKRFGLLEELLQTPQGNPQLARQITPRYAPTAAVDGQVYHFSRFAFLRKGEHGWMLESSRGLSRLRVINEELLAHLSEAREPLADWQRWLVESDILVTGLQAEQEKRSLWSFSDRLFHHRTRYGNHQRPIGKKPQAESQLLPQRVAGPGSKILLRQPQPDSQNQVWSDLLSARRSLRQSQGGEWSLERIGEFLYHSVACQQQRRPYPSAGGVYEIEILLGWTQPMPGVEAGSFLYLPQEHALLRLPAAPALVNELLAGHQKSSQSETAPTVSILLAARFEKIFSRYDSIAYALILKNAGVLLHQFGLVATLMGWGGCPIGVGDSMAVSQLSGEDSEAFAAVAEFALW